MDRAVQLPEPAAELLAACERTVPGWLGRITSEAASAGGVDPSVLPIDDLVTATSSVLLDLLSEFLATDVDSQTTNPLTLFRQAVAAPTELLQRAGVPPVARRDPFEAERFPDDVYALAPAAWSDIDAELQQPGLVWGAWKAMTVLRRRRDEGLR